MRKKYGSARHFDDRGFEHRACDCRSAVIALYSIRSSRRFRTKRPQIAHGERAPTQTLLSKNTRRHTPSSKLIAGFDDKLPITVAPTGLSEASGVTIVRTNPMMASLKRNVIANGIGQGWRGVMVLAFIPLYIRYLGIEAYALIGIFALLQNWLALFDMGMKPSLGREMARFTGGAHDSQSIRNLLRSVELIVVAVAASIALGVWASSSWLASNWLRAENLPVEVVARALAIMGAVIALRLIEDIYVSCLAGLELQVQQNAVIAFMATARGLGAVAVLKWVSPTIGAFFIWQGLVSLATVAMFVGVVYRALPPAPKPARLSLEAMRGIGHFAGGMMTITCLVLLLTQVDKIILSRLLTLKAYGYYALAWVVANGLYWLAAPVTAAFYPRFTALVTLGNESAARAAYHQGAQMVTVFMGGAAVMVIVFHSEVIFYGGPGIRQLFRGWRRLLRSWLWDRC